MKEPKTKPKAPPPKTLERSIRTPKGVRTGLSKTIDGIQKGNKANNALQKQIPDDQRIDKPETYATDNVVEKGEYAIRKIGGKTAETTKKAVNKGYEKIREHHNVKQREKCDKRFNDDMGKETGSQANNKAKTHAQNQAKKTAQTTKQTADRSSKIKQTVDSKKSVKSAIYTGKKTNKSIKTSKKGVKNTKRTVKTTKIGVKTAAKSAKRTAQAAKKAVIAAKKAAVAAAKFAKLTVKAILTAVKAVIATVKVIIAAMAAGGWVVVIIIIVAVIIAIVSSPLAIFTNDTDGTTPTISEVVQEINGEYVGEITGIITNAGVIDEIIIEGEAASSEFHVSNWIDVIGIFSVKSTVTSNDEEFIPVIYMEDKQISDLKDVFWNMNTISYEIIEEEIEPEPTPAPSQTFTPNPSVTPASPTPEPTPETYRTLVISIESKTYEDGIEIYNMSDEQIEVLEELMTPDYFPMFMDICGMDSYIGLTSEQMANLINDLPEGELGSVIVKYAISRLGHPYSRAKRGQGNYVDCSYFARWCYQQAGVSHFTAGTAAEQTRYCVNNGLTIAYSNLQPGDLIFWSFNVNGRFMNVTHTGIYAGNGYVIDASSSRGMVVYRPVFGESSIVACGRPHVR